MTVVVTLLVLALLVTNYAVWQIRQGVTALTDLVEIQEEELGRLRELIR